jgi:hypothetical protein
MEFFLHFKLDFINPWVEDRILKYLYQTNSIAYLCGTYCSTYKERWRDRPCETLATFRYSEKVPNPIPAYREKISLRKFLSFFVG